jgi:KDO2-lipid IV(A) lauroyltransferase
VAQALKANHVVCLLCDRDMAGTGVPVDFFGERTTLPGGPATLALRSGAPLVPIAVYTSWRGHEAVLRPPLDTTRHGKFRADVSRITQDLAGALEALIRRAPDQWHLLQPNWPSDWEPAVQAAPQRGAVPA